MKLVIFDCNDVNFILYLINIIIDYIQNNVNYNKLIRIEKYINSLPKYKSKLKRYISCREIILAATYNYTYKKYPDRFEIMIDKNQKLFGLNAKLYDLCKLINYGSISIQGYPIFSDAIEYVEDNIDILYSNYKEG